MIHVEIVEPTARQLAQHLVDHAYMLSAASWLALAAMCQELANATATLDQYGADR